MNEEKLQNADNELRSKVELLVDALMRQIKSPAGADDEEDEEIMRRIYGSIRDVCPVVESAQEILFARLCQWLDGKTYSNYDIGLCVDSWSRYGYSFPSLPVSDLEQFYTRLLKNRELIRFFIAGVDDLYSYNDGDFITREQAAVCAPSRINWLLSGCIPTAATPEDRQRLVQYQQCIVAHAISFHKNQPSILKDLPAWIDICCRYENAADVEKFLALSTSCGSGELLGMAHALSELLGTDHSMSRSLVLRILDRAMVDTSAAPNVDAQPDSEETMVKRCLVELRKFPNRISVQSYFTSVKEAESTIALWRWAIRFLGEQEEVADEKDTKATDDIFMPMFAYALGSHCVGPVEVKQYLRNLAFMSEDRRAILVNVMRIFGDNALDVIREHAFCNPDEGVRAEICTFLVKQATQQGGRPNIVAALSPYCIVNRLRTLTQKPETAAVDAEAPASLSTARMAYLLSPPACEPAVAENKTVVQPPCSSTFHYQRPAVPSPQADVGSPPSVPVDERLAHELAIAVCTADWRMSLRLQLAQL